MRYFIVVMLIRCYIRWPVIKNSQCLCGFWPATLCSGKRCLRIYISRRPLPCCLYMVYGCWRTSTSIYCQEPSYSEHMSREYDLKAYCQSYRNPASRGAENRNDTPAGSTNWYIVAFIVVSPSARKCSRISQSMYPSTFGDD